MRQSIGNVNGKLNYIKQKTTDKNNKIILRRQHYEITLILKFQ